MTGKINSYETLVELIKENGGKLEIELEAVKVHKGKEWRFPRLGRGYAWADRMEGSIENKVTVDFNTTESEKENRGTLLTWGYGYGWAQKMKGYVNGNEINLTTEKVGRDDRWTPWFMVGFSFGYAWADEMSGNCGDRLNASYKTTQVGKDKQFLPPGFGFGYGWSKKGILKLELI